MEKAVRFRRNGSFETLNAYTTTHTDRAQTKRAFRDQVLEHRARREITCAQKDVLMRLATFLGRDGLWPSHETIAKAADVSVRTVIRALERAYALGILTSTKRTVMRGARRVRTSNAYTLVVTKAEQMKAKAGHLRRAVFRAVLPSDKKAEKVKHLSFLRPQWAAQSPERTPQEMLAAVQAWAREAEPRT